MKRTAIAFVVCMVFGFSIAAAAQAKYAPDWKSLDARPIPAWYDDAKFGIFIHWGVYAVPSYGEWYWYNLNHSADTKAFHLKTFGEKFKYADFAPMFKAELFDPDLWAALFVKSGARYVVLTSKHHDGYAMFPSVYSWNWNSMDTGPHRDLVGDLFAAVRARGLKMGVYYSLYEWYNPLYLANTPMYVDTHMVPQIKEIFERYKPSIFWTDGEWDKTSDVWRSRDILSWIFNESPSKEDVVVNDRWGSDTRNAHGGFYTSENANVGTDANAAGAHKWEECHTFGATWGYDRMEKSTDMLTSEQVVHMLIEVVSRGGNLLLNVGPTADGLIPTLIQERLLEIGAWLKVNGDAIYGTRPWRVVEDGKNIPPVSYAHGGGFQGVMGKYTKSNWRKSVRYTSKDGAVYAISLAWPGKELVLSAPVPSEGATAAMLGVPGNLEWRSEGGKMIIEVPQLSVAEVPCRYAYVFKLTGVK
jgi:alpha-L-fucosidase